LREKKPIPGAPAYQLKGMQSRNGPKNVGFGGSLRSPIAVEIDNSELARGHMETRKVNLVFGKAPLRTRKLKANGLKKIGGTSSGLQWFDLEKIAFEKTNFVFREPKSRSPVKEVARHQR
jgi:hypothetical protein